MKIPFKYKQKIRNLAGSYKGSTFKLSANQKQEVIAELKEDWNLLESNYGFDISGWNIEF